MTDNVNDDKYAVYRPKSTKKAFQGPGGLQELNDQRELDTFRRSDSYGPAMQNVNPKIPANERRKIEIELMKEQREKQMQQATVKTLSNNLAKLITKGVA